MNYVIQFIVAMIATFSFAIIYNAPKKDLVFCGLTGAIGWIIYFICTRTVTGVVAASLAATFVLTIFARFCAAGRRTPVTVYLVTGIFPLVPGAGIYYTAFYFFTSNKEKFAAVGAETLEIAIAIVFGIIFGSAIPQAVFNKITRNPGTKKSME